MLGGIRTGRNAGLAAGLGLEGGKARPSELRRHNTTVRRLYLRRHRHGYRAHSDVLLRIPWPDQSRVELHCAQAATALRACLYRRPTSPRPVYY
jgi:hypothetical protein